MGRAASKQQRNDLYGRDFFAWTQEQSRLLQEERFKDLDLAHLVDEVASVGISEKREIRSRLAVLIGHLLKWMMQPGARTPSWRRTILEQRMQINEVLEDSPSLRSYPATVFGAAYRSGRLLASDETGIGLEVFPEDPGFTIEEALSSDFWPQEPGLERP